MSRQFFIDLARSGHAAPIGTDLVLREKADHRAIIHDGARLGRVIEEGARRYRTPLAIPLMDLSIEKAVMLGAMEVPEEAIETYHFREAPPADPDGTLERRIMESAEPRMLAACGALRYIAGHTDLFPVGMCIGPFSLVTKLMEDPITAVYMKGAGMGADEEPSVGLLEVLLDLSARVIICYLQRQVEAGARAVILCEPAANTVYFSPKQIGGGSDIFDRCVIDPNMRIQSFLDRAGVDLVFHDCGELDDAMITRFVSLNPSVISLGSSRILWEDAALIPRDIVIYGNLPTRQFYSDDLVTEQEISAMAHRLLERMGETGHPFILGSECDVLSVPGKEETIGKKVHAFLGCCCHEKDRRESIHPDREVPAASSRT